MTPDVVSDRLRWWTSDGRSGELLLTAVEVTIGRSPDCFLVVDAALVSRLHCRIRRSVDGWTVEDAGSSNGTFLGGQRVSTRRAFRPGDRLQLGVGPGGIEAELVAGVTKALVPPVPEDPSDDGSLELTAEVARWRKHAGQLQLELVAAREGEASARRAASKADKEIERINAEMRELRDLLGQARTANAELRATVEEHAKRLATGEADQRDQLIALRDQVEGQRHEVRKLQGERERLDAALAADRSRANTAETNRDVAIARVAELEAEVSHLQQVIKHLEQRVADLEPLAGG